MLRVALGLLWFRGVAVFYMLILLISATIARLYEAIRRRHVDDAANLLSPPSLTVVIPCYLPNEERIIFETIDHILRNLDYPIAFTVMVVYNTPKPLEIEITLAAMDGQESEGGNTLRVLHVKDSRSKGENLNAALKVVDSECVAIYDADHRPESDSLILLADALRRHDCDCVQGSYNLAQRDTVFDYFVDADFFLCYQQNMAGLMRCFGSGFFLGTNALWRTATLRSYPFIPNHLTEDMEVSLRALREGAHIRFLPHSQSMELPADDLPSLWQQRLRWQLGGDQVPQPPQLLEPLCSRLSPMFTALLLTRLRISGIFLNPHPALLPLPPTHPPPTHPCHSLLNPLHPTPAHTAHTRAHPCTLACRRPHTLSHPYPHTPTTRHPHPSAVPTRHWMLPPLATPGLEDVWRIVERARSGAEPHSSILSSHSLPHQPQRTSHCPLPTAHSPPLPTAHC